MVVNTEYENKNDKQNQMLVIKNMMDVKIQLDDNTRDRLVSKIQVLSNEVNHFHAKLLVYDIINKDNLSTAD